MPTSQAPKTEVTIDQQIQEVKRELRMRESVYTRLVSGGKMPDADKAQKIAVMRAVLQTLERVKEQGNPQMKLGV